MKTVMQTSTSRFVSTMCDYQVKVLFFINFLFFLHAYVHMKTFLTISQLNFLFLKTVFQHAIYYILVYHIPKIQLLLSAF